ncbi:MAG: tryptophan synthase beta chain, partial [Flammeovirgaceae bacterium]
MKLNINEEGFYGEFGGAFIPEMLHPNVQELKDKYLSILASADFKAELEALLKDYVGRPTPLYLAERLTEHYGAEIWLKREDLCHTG